MEKTVQSLDDVYIVDDEVAVRAAGTPWLAPHASSTSAPDSGPDSPQDTGDVGDEVSVATSSQLAPTASASSTVALGEAEVPEIATLGDPQEEAFVAPAAALPTPGAEVEDDVDEAEIEMEEPLLGGAALSTRGRGQRGSAASESSTWPAQPSAQEDVQWPSRRPTGAEEDGATDSSGVSGLFKFVSSQPALVEEGFAREPLPDSGTSDSEGSHHSEGGAVDAASGEAAIGVDLDTAAAAAGADDGMDATAHLVDDRVADEFPPGFESIATETPSSTHRLDEHAPPGEERPAGKPLALDPLNALLQGRIDDGPKQIEVAEQDAEVAPDPRRGMAYDLLDVDRTLGSGMAEPTCRASDDILGESALTAGQRISNALAASSNVDFPMITDICERVFAAPQEAAEAVELLVQAFGDRTAHPRRRLKALTIMHELVYDQRARAELRDAEGARQALEELQQARNTGLGDATDEHIRMFATELERLCFEPVESVSSSADGSARKRDKANELFREISFSLQANLAAVGMTTPVLPPAPARPAAPVARKRTLAMELLKDFGTTVQNNLRAAGEVAERNLLEAAAVIDSAIDSAFDEAASTTDQIMAGYQNQSAAGGDREAARGSPTAGATGARQGGFPKQPAVLGGPLGWPPPLSPLQPPVEDHMIPTPRSGQASGQAAKPPPASVPSEWE